jgi:ubiquinone/menaquinone biosynthesis C-methylase UbiE
LLQTKEISPMKHRNLIIGACACLTAVLAVALSASAQQGGRGTQAPADHMEHRFDNPEQSAKGFDDPARDAWQIPDRVIDALGLKPGQAVADIGAGTGYFTVRLARSAAAPTVYAVDIEEKMVQYLRGRAAKEGLESVIAVQASADRTNLPAPVDVVLIVNTYHHIPNRVAYFRELRKSMTPSARLAIVDFRKGVPGGPPDHFRFTAEQITSELTKAGFALQAQHDFLPRQLFLIFQ